MYEILIIFKNRAVKRSQDSLRDYEAESLMASNTHANGVAPPSIALFLLPPPLTLHSLELSASVI